MPLTLNKNTQRTFRFLHHPTGDDVRHGGGAGRMHGARLWPELPRGLRGNTEEQLRRGTCWACCVGCLGSWL